MEGLGSRRNGAREFCQRRAASWDENRRPLESETVISHDLKPQYEPLLSRKWAMCVLGDARGRRKGDRAMLALNMGPYCAETVN